MTDPELIKKKLAFVETCVQQLRELADPDRIHDDIREERFVAHTLQLAIQATLDVASHIVSDERLGEPESNHQLYDLLVKGGWLLPEHAKTMRSIVGFRNILVHGYQAVDLEIMRDVVMHRLDDLLHFASTIRARLG